MSEYANPDVLVSTEWLAEHLDDDDVVAVEVDVDTRAYEAGHIPGAVGWNWQSQLSDQVRRDIVGQKEIGALLSQSGISSDTTIVLYGDNNNWFAAWAYWQLKIYGHKDVRILNGGRVKWFAEGREVTTDAPSPEPTNYEAAAANNATRAMLPEVLRAWMPEGHAEHREAALVDVRSPDEFTGKILSPPGLPETCQRGGHIPGARNIPWGEACNEDGTFRSAAELKELYEGVGVTPDKNVIAYCRIGERSSHTWFVLKELLGYPNVKNYDGSWTEWGNLVGAEIERGE